MSLKEFSYLDARCDDGGVMTDPAIIPFPSGKHRRVIIVQIEPATRMIDVFLWPRDPQADLDRTFPTAGRACRYACELAVRHHFPIKSPGQPDEWLEAMVDHYRRDNHGRG